MLFFVIFSKKKSNFNYYFYYFVKVVPYLLRRAQENGDVLSNANHERTLLKQELKRRLFGK